MALIQCTECNAQLSDKAAACVKCGAPTKGVVTTQQTSKKFKAMKLIGWLLCITGFGAATAGQLWGAALIVLGVLSYVVGRFSAWWHNG